MHDTKPSEADILSPDPAPTDQESPAQAGADSQAAEEKPASPARKKLKEKVAKAKKAKLKRAVDASNLDLITLEDGTQIVAGTRHPKNKLYVFTTVRPRNTALAVISEHFTVNEQRTLLFYADSFQLWNGSYYETTEPLAISKVAGRTLHNAFEAIACDSFHRLEPFPETKRRVEDVIQAIKEECLVSNGLQPTCFLAAPPILNETKVLARDLICLKSGVLHVPTLMLLQPSPLLFNTTALDFDYDPSQTSCEMWLWFLNTTFSSDVEQIECLQEFFGYLLVDDTSLQKALVILGPSGAGKGTILRVIKAMLGGDSRVASPTAANLASNFGLSALDGKPVAMIADGRFKGPDLAKAIEQLLRVIGEDPVDIDKKYAQPTTKTIRARIIIASNEMPNLPDAADAFARRFLVLHTPNKVKDTAVNPAIEPEIHSEMPAIFNWALEGLRRLRKRGRFVQPKSTMEWKKEMSELSSPLIGFARDCVEFTDEDEDRVTATELYSRYVRWCDSEGQEHKKTKAVMCRDWNAAFSKYRTYTRADGTKGFRRITLKNDYVGASESNADYEQKWR